ncbi:MAG: urea carboxylase-associated family protein [Pseudomonadota bacterium]
MRTLRPRTAIALELDEGDALTVQSKTGGQVCDLVAYTRANPAERFSAAHTFAFEETTQIGLFSQLWSSHCDPLLTIVRDDVGVHDLYLPPCSHRARKRFAPLDEEEARCGNALEYALEKYGIAIQPFEVSLSIFTNIKIDPESGLVLVTPPELIAPGTIKLRAEKDLLIGLSTCSSAVPRDYGPPSIQYEVEPNV